MPGRSAPVVPGFVQGWCACIFNKARALGFNARPCVELACEQSERQAPRPQPRSPASSMLHASRAAGEPSPPCPPASSWHARATSCGNATPPLPTTCIKLWKCHPPPAHLRQAGMRGYAGEQATPGAEAGRRRRGSKSGGRGRSRTSSALGEGGIGSEAGAEGGAGSGAEGGVVQVGPSPAKGEGADCSATPAAVYTARRAGLVGGVGLGRAGRVGAGRVGVGRAGQPWRGGRACSYIKTFVGIG